MNENKLIAEFWSDCDDANFSKDATVLFFYLLKTFREKRDTDIKLHPNKLSSVIKGFTSQNVVAASEELEKRGFLSFTPSNEQNSSGVYRFVKAGCEKRASSSKAEASAHNNAQGSTDASSQFPPDYPIPSKK